jgi:YggT family protein
MIVRVVNLIFNILQAAILIEALLSWIAPSTQNELTNLLHSITEPLLQPGRRLQEMILPNMMVDFSPIIALIILSILQNIVISIIGLI